MTSGSFVVLAAGAGTRVVCLSKGGVSGDKIAAWTRGRYEGVTKQTNAPWSQGTVVYFDTTGNKFTTVTTANTLAGFATAAAATTTATGNIDLNG